MSETAAAFGVSWWTVRASLNEACVLTLPDVNEPSPRVLGIDEHRFRSVRFFRDPESSSWIRHEPWMTTIVDLDTGQVLGVVDGRDHGLTAESSFPGKRPGAPPMLERR